MTPVARWDIEVIADSDSRWKWGGALAQRLAPNGAARVHATLLDGRSSPTDRQVRDVGLFADSMRRASITELVPAIAETNARVVVLACVGGTIQALLHALARAWDGRVSRPVVVTGYVGLVYERVVEGLLLRAGADVVLANSAADADQFRRMLDAVDADRDSVIQTALPFLGGEPHDPTAAGRDRPFTVTFVTQPGVPQTRSERRYALMQVVEHAARRPDRHLIVKLRGRIGERTTHIEPYHYTSLLPARRIPDNVDFVYGPMSDVLDRTDLCVTVSSTAALEAMHRNIPTAILTDFGVCEALGNQAFLHSKVLTSWAALHEGTVPKTDAGWAARNGVHDPDPFGALRRRVAELSASDTTLPPLRPWYSSDEAAHYLPALLRRHGLDAIGVPLPDGSNNGTGPSVPSRVLRALARRIYRLGLRTLEPRIRRWGQL